MKKQSNNLGIIPARAGSKGIPNKNLMKVGSKTLIEHAIYAGQNSELLDDLVITSDHPDILATGTAFGVNVRKRPGYMATDESPVVECLQDAVSFMEQLKGNGFQYDNIILLQVTSPIRTGTDIDNVITIMDEQSEIEGVVSVCASGVNHPSHQYYLDDNLNKTISLLKPYQSTEEKERRQDVQDTYTRSGALYTARRRCLMDESTMIVDIKASYIMPKKYWCNIDDPDDLDVARIIVPAWEKNLI
jgi:CMP-N,N'-diacetyllegionaminic acid synthase|tara:strand:- start:148 stop:885 length:738 start_codon:yes stop_codon:yes gene_type:complete